MLVIFVPALPLGVWMFITGVGTDQIGLGILGLVITAASSSFDLIGALGIPAKARLKSNLSKEIRATEAQLRSLDGRAHLLPLPTPQGMLLSLSTPVFHF
jgi:hypothetical protein